MIATAQLPSLAGATVIDLDGDKIGKVVDVYQSATSDDGTFVTVSTGMFGGKASFVPLLEAETREDDLVVPYAKDLIKDAPRIDADEALSSEEEERLFAHYGLAVDHGSTTTGHDTSGPSTDDAMTVSEERLQVGTTTQEAGRARLRKYVTTETETVTVPVTREQVVVEREPITDANAGAALDGPDISEEEHEVVLHEEVPVAATTTVPVERVRLGTETVTEQATVTEDVRKEHVETEGVTER